MDALGADDDATALRWQRLPVDVLEMSDRLGPIMLDAGTAPTGDDFVFPGALYERIEQHHLQIAAMNGELRHVVAGKAAGRFAVDELAEAIVEAIFAGGDCDLRERIFQPERA